jgi:hypothetical protein
MAKNLLQLVLPKPSRKGSSRMELLRNPANRVLAPLRRAMTPDGYVCPCLTAGISSFWHSRQCTLNEGTARLSRRWYWAPRSYGRTMAGNVPRAANLGRKNQGSNEGKKIGGLNNSTGWLAGRLPSRITLPKPFGYAKCSSRLHLTLQYIIAAVRNTVLAQSLQATRSKGLSLNLGNSS